MGNVPWRKLCESPAAYERAIKILLMRLHPEAEAIDGAGGDQGRDVQLRADGRLSIYEMKAFCRRLTSSQKRQIKGSLARAAEHSPTRWRLVMPLDHSPAELQWFDTLREQYPFPLEWHGISWLEAQLLSHRDVERAMAGPEHELLELARQFGLEQAALATVDDYLERQRRLADLADHLSPAYRIGYVRSADGSDQLVYDAKEDWSGEPPDLVAGSFNIELPTANEDRQVRQALEEHRLFGEPVTIPGRYIKDFKVSGPPNVVPASATAPQRVAKIELLPAIDRAGLPNTTMTVRNPVGAVIVTVPFIGDRRTRGDAGGSRLYSYDPERTLELIVSFSSATADPTLTVNVLSNEGRYPYEFLRAIKLMGSMTSPNRVEVTVSVPPGPSLPLGGMNLDSREVSEDTEAVNQLVVDLAAIQEVTGEYFHVPPEFTGKQGALAHRIARLFSGETVSWVAGHRALGVHRDFAGAILDRDRSRDEREHVEVYHPDPVVGLFDRHVHVGPLIISGDILIVDDQYLRTPKADQEYLPVLVDPGPAGFAAHRPTEVEIAAYLASKPIAGTTEISTSVRA